MASSKKSKRTPAGAKSPSRPARKPAKKAPGKPARAPVRKAPGKSSARKPVKKVARKVAARAAPKRAARAPAKAAAKSRPAKSRAPAAKTVASAAPATKRGTSKPRARRVAQPARTTAVPPPLQAPGPSVDDPVAPNALQPGFPAEAARETDASVAEEAPDQDSPDAPLSAITAR